MRLIYVKHLEQCLALVLLNVGYVVREIQTSDYNLRRQEKIGKTKIKNSIGE